MSNITYNNTPDLKFWCQKAIPLVYDDSLSYYEVLCKVVTYLNSTTEDVRNLIEEVNGIIIDLENVAIIDDSVTSNDRVWSSQKVVDYVPKIQDSTVSNSTLWSSQKTRTDIEDHITNNGTTWSNKAFSTQYVQNNYYTKTAVDNSLANKVDKVSGKGLSTNDYTNEDKAIVDGVTSALAGKVNTSAVGANNGVASLGSDGKVPSAQLPSYVDDVLEYASLSAFPATGESGKIYVALDTNKTYRWSGTAYVEISESLALGETASTAYAGNKGKQNADNIATLQGYVPSGTSGSNKLVNATELANGLSGKQNTLTFDNTPTANSNNPVKSGGVYSALGDKVSWSNAEKSVKKNICDVNNALSASNFISANNDDILSFKDVSTIAWTNTYIGKIYVESGKQYVLTTNDGQGLTYGRIGASNSPTAIPASATAPDITISASGVTYAEILGTNVKKTEFTANFTGYMYLWFCNDSHNSGHTTFNKGFICCYAGVPTDFVPYIPDNTELMTWEANAKTGVHQLIQYDLESLKADNTTGTWNNNEYTHNNTTFTVNSDLSISVNTGTGGASGEASFSIKNKFTNIKGNIILSSNFVGSKNYIFLNAYSAQNAYVKTICQTTQADNVAGNIDYKGYAYVGVKVKVSSGEEITNGLVKPMLRYAEDTCTDFGLPAMTNRELTDKINLTHISYEKTSVQKSDSYSVTLPKNTIWRVMSSTNIGILYALIFVKYSAIEIVNITDNTQMVSLSLTSNDLTLTITNSSVSYNANVEIEKLTIGSY